MAEPIEMPFGLWTRVGPRKHVLGGMHTAATWQIPLNRLFAATMPSFCQITLTTCYDLYRACMDERKNILSLSRKMSARMLLRYSILEAYLLEPEDQRHCQIKYSSGVRKNHKEVFLTFGWIGDRHSADVYSASALGD